MKECCYSWLWRFSVKCIYLSTLILMLPQFKLVKYFSLVIIKNFIGAVSLYEGSCFLSSPLIYKLGSYITCFVANWFHHHSILTIKVIKPSNTSLKDFDFRHCLKLEISPISEYYLLHELTSSNHSNECFSTSWNWHHPICFLCKSILGFCNYLLMYFLSFRSVDESGVILYFWQHHFLWFLFSTSHFSPPN